MMDGESRREERWEQGKNGRERVGRKKNKNTEEEEERKPDGDERNCPLRRGSRVVLCAVFTICIHFAFSVLVFGLWIPSH